MVKDKEEKQTSARDKQTADDRATELASQAAVEKAVFDLTHDKEGNPVPIEAPTA